MWSSRIGDTPFNDGLALRLHGAGRVWAAEFKYSTKGDAFSVALVEFSSMTTEASRSASPPSLTSNSIHQITHLSACSTRRLLNRDDWTTGLSL